MNADAKKNKEAISNLIVLINKPSSTVDGLKKLKDIKRNDLKDLLKQIADLSANSSISGKIKLDKEQQIELNKALEQISKNTKGLKKLTSLLTQKIDSVQDSINAKTQTALCQTSKSLEEAKEDLSKILLANEKLEKEKAKKEEKEKKKKEKKLALKEEREEKLKEYTQYYKNMYALRSIVQSMFSGYSETYRQEVRYIEYGQTNADPISNIFSQPANFNFLDILTFNNKQGLTQNPHYNSPININSILTNNNNFVYPSFGRNLSTIDTSNDFNSEDI